MRTRILGAVLALVLLAGSVHSQSRPTTRPASRPSTGPTAASLPATQPTLDGARYLYRHGRYGEAAELFRKLAGQPDQAVDAALGLADTDMMVGKYDEALSALTGVSERAVSDARWHVAKAKALAAVGQYDQALAGARKAFELRQDWAPAIQCLGEALETLGKKPEAVEVYNALEQAIARRDFASDAPSLVAAGTVLDRLSVLTRRKASEQAQNILRNYFQKAYQDVDKEYWPANVAAGILLLNKYKVDQAEAEFKLAAKVNPNLPDVHVGAGVKELARWEFEKAVAEADKALAINPRHADALLLKAYTLMQWRKFDQVAGVVEKILAFNPSHLEGLSVMAALHVRAGDPDKAQPFIERTLKVNPNYGQLYECIGQWLSSERQFAEAETYFRKAMEVSPELAGPVTQLGLLYMQTGQEAKAKETLEAAFALDDFRSDVLNYLRLLERLEKFQVKETDHFIIKVNAATDGVLLDWLAEQAEKIHAEVSKDFDHVPLQKTLVELFPDQAGFSVRITGRGWIPTVGACTGSVIAMPAPDPLRGGFGTFNWAVVLRHEYTHAVTLSATGNRIPHWFTEACAVWEQPDRRNFQAVQMLVDAVRHRKLFPVRTLDWGFIRPRPGQGSRSLAYAQSELMFEYIVEKTGYETIIAMLKGFRDGQSQEDVFGALLKTTEDQFDKDFAAWAGEQVRSWGFDSEPDPDLSAALEGVKKAPESPDALATLARAQLRQRQPRPAEDTARKALKFQPDNRRALEVLAEVLMTQRKQDEALQTARKLEEVDPRSVMAARVRSEVHLARRQYVEAIPALEAFKQRCPLDSYGYQKLADLYMQMGQAETALPNLIELHRRTLKDAKYARQVADIYRTSSTPEKALEFYEQVIQINPYDGGAYKAMAGLYLRTEAYDRAVLAMNSVCLLEPNSADAWTQLAMVYLRIARATKAAEMYSQARSAAEKALAIDPACQAREVLEIVQQESK